MIFTANAAPAALLFFFAVTKHETLNTGQRK